jgi:UrcA family protein
MHCAQSFSIDPPGAMDMSNTRALKSYTRLVLALSATIMASAPICSHADDSAPSYKVKYASPATAEEAAHLYSRIERAANYACGTSSSDAEVIAGAPGPCVHAAISRAIRDSKNRSLAQVYISKNGMAEAQKFGIAGDVYTAKQ